MWYGEHIRGLYVPRFYGAMDFVHVDEEIGKSYRFLEINRSNK